MLTKPIEVAEAEFDLRRHASRYAETRRLIDQNKHEIEILSTILERARIVSAPRIGMEIGVVNRRPNRGIGRARAVSRMRASAALSSQTSSSA